MGQHKEEGDKQRQNEKGRDHTNKKERARLIENKRD